jgi:integrase
MTVAKQYQVRIPEQFRDAFPELKPGQDRLRKRWKTVSAGRAWVKQIEEQIAQLRVGADESEVRRLRATPDQISIKAAIDGWLSSLPRRARTIKSYRWTIVHLVRIAGEIRLDEWSLAAWDLYRKARKGEKASDDALARERQALQAAAKWAAERGYAVHAQVPLIPKPRTAPKIVRRFDPESTRKAIAGLTPGSRARVIAELIAGTGMRSGELRAARIEWVSWTEGLVKIPHSQAYSPKGGRPRQLPISKALARTLREWIGERRKGLLFPPEARQRLGSGIGLWRVIADLRKAGVIQHGLHDLRVYYLSTLAHRGLPIRDVQELAGHAHSKTTDRYLHASPRYLESARKALDLDSDPDSDSE